MLLIEIILTVFVWRRGWQWLSLIPMGASLGIGLLMGMGMGASGGTMTDGIVGFAAVVEIISIVALVVMLIVPPPKKS